MNLAFLGGELKMSSKIFDPRSNTEIDAVATYDGSEPNGNSMMLGFLSNSSYLMFSTGTNLLVDMGTIENNCDLFPNTTVCPMLVRYKISFTSDAPPGVPPPTRENPEQTLPADGLLNSPGGRLPNTGSFASGVLPSTALLLGLGFIVGTALRKRKYF